MNIEPAIWTGGDVAGKPSYWTHSSGRRAYLPLTFLGVRIWKFKESLNLLDNKEHDEGVTSHLSVSRKAVTLTLWGLILTLSGFLCGCIFAIVSLAAGHQVVVFSNETTFAEDRSFLGTLLKKASAIRSHLIEIRVTAPPGPISRNFTLDETFRMKPSLESNEAWRSIIPSMAPCSTVKGTALTTA